ncbi:MAG: hypothetical protein ACREFE_08765 [Limisphaerales bacterium]
MGKAARLAFLWVLGLILINEFGELFHMSNFCVALLLFVVGLSLVSSIMWNRLVPHLGVLLKSVNERIQFPVSKIIPLELKNTDNPKRVILKFSKSIGFYNGEICLKNGSNEIKRKLPILPEYRGKFLKFYNEDIPRQTNTIIIPLKNYQTDSPLVLSLNLNHNIQNPELKNALDVSDEEEVEIAVRGARRQSKSIP